MSSFISRYGGNMGARASGLASLQRALADGMTINSVRDLTAREGVTFGQRAQDLSQCTSV